MKFSKVIGKCDPAMVKEAENKLSAVFTELSLSYDNKGLGSNLGGDPFIFNLVYPLPHICDAMGVQIDEFEKQQKEIEKKLANGEELTKEEKDQISDEVKKYKKHMKGKVLRTAATNGRQFFWAPDFVIKKSKIGLRLVVIHEALHAHLSHPSRRGSRLPRLFNIAIDYKVNHVALMDLKSRGRKDYIQDFKKELGDFIALEELAQLYRDPFNPPERLAHFNPIHNLREQADPAYKHPGDDAPPMYYAEEKLEGDMLKPENIYAYLYSCIPKCPKCGKLGMYKKPDEYKKLQKQIEDQKKKDAEAKAKKEAEGKDPSAANAKDEEQADNQTNPGTGKGKKTQKPTGKGSHAGKGMKGQKNDQHDPSDEGESCEHEGQCDNPQSGKGQSKGEGQGQGEESSEGQSGAGNGQQEGEGEGGACCDGEEQGQGQGGSCGEPGDKEGSCGSCGCPTCGGGDSEYVDPFGHGDLTDEHMDCDVSEDELAKRLYDAAEMAKRLGGKIPLGMEDEIGELLAPKIRWEDIVRQLMTKKRDGMGRNNWQKPKSRPLFAGLYVPKKEDYFLNILVAYDCSGSMSAEDIAHGISQLQVIDTRGELSCVAFDCVAYWDQMVKIKKADKENLAKLIAVGRGGTAVNLVFNQYEKHCGKVDLIIIISDLYLSDTELNDVKKPGKETDVLWLCTSENKWRPPFGRVKSLRNE
jgi:predicted metal-dependent peptidase